MDYVIDKLRNNYFPDRYWKKLGCQLGLDETTLDDIDEEYGTLKERFEKCMHTWLKGEKRKQVKTWKTLANALDRMGQKKVADKIRRVSYY